MNDCDKCHGNHYELTKSGMPIPCECIREGVEPKPASDSVHRPEHYTRWKIEPVTFLMRNDCEFWRANIVKYAMRAGYKIQPDLTKRESEIDDLEKAIRYCEMRINFLNGEQEL